jgi:hypothetical protein
VAGTWCPGAKRGWRCMCQLLFHLRRVFGPLIHQAFVLMTKVNAMRNNYNKSSLQKEIRKKIRQYRHL